VAEEFRYVLQSSEMLGKVHTNIAQDIIVITDDRVYRVLSPWCQSVEKCSSWVGPVSLTVTIWLTLLSATFQDKFGISKEEWSALFVFGGIVATIWCICTLYRCMCKRPQTLDQLLEQLKASSLTKQG